MESSIFIISQDGFEGQHTSYWAQYPGHYEHWRFSKGYDQGWEDAYRFLLHNVANEHAVSELGFQGLWTKKRVYDHGIQNGFGNNLWEYGKARGFMMARPFLRYFRTPFRLIFSPHSEHGYVQAIRAANLDFGIAYC